MEDIDINELIIFIFLCKAMPDVFLYVIPLCMHICSYYRQDFCLYTYSILYFHKYVCIFPCMTVVTVRTYIPPCLYVCLNLLWSGFCRVNIYSGQFHCILVLHSNVRHNDLLVHVSPVCFLSCYSRLRTFLSKHGQHCPTTADDALIEMWLPVPVEFCADY